MQRKEKHFRKKLSLEQEDFKKKSVPEPLH